MKRNALKREVCKILYAVPISLALINTSCINKIGDDIEEGTIPISFSTKISKSTTKVTTSAFELGDRVGLFAMLTSTSLNNQRYIDNLCLECGEDALLIPEKEVFYPEGDATLDFISYYPYHKEGISNGNSILNISVEANQSTKVKHSVSDFLTAKVNKVQSGNEPVELTYKHQLAKINITLSPKEGENADDILKANPKIIATGFNTQALYDLQTGNISGLTTKADISPFGNWKKQSNGTLSGKEFIIIPQEDTNGEQAFLLEWNGKLYTCPMPAVTMKGNTEFEISIDAIQATSQVLNCITSSIKAWEYQENGQSENNHNLTGVRIAALSFSTSDVYRVYYQSMPVAEICKEYLYSANNIASRAIVVYPVVNEKTDLQKGDVLQLLDEKGKVHGGNVSWDTEKNSLTYTAGNSEIIESFYINENGKITLVKPNTPTTINVSNYQIRDIRNGKLQTYPIVKIGTQYWMKEDLQATYYLDKTPVTFKTKLGEGAGYFQDDNKTLFFYNGEALLKGELAPLGWKVPNKEDWNKLITYINNSASTLKSGIWKTFNAEQEISPVTNLSGLSILPNGLYTEGKDTGNPLHGNAGTTAVHWINGDTQGTLAEDGILLMGNTDLVTFGSNKVKNKDYYQAFSIRCIKE